MTISQQAVDGMLQKLTLRVDLLCGTSFPFHSIYQVYEPNTEHKRVQRVYNNRNNKDYQLDQSQPHYFFLFNLTIYTLYFILVFIL